MTNKEIMMQALAALLNLVEEDLNPQQLSGSEITMDQIQAWFSLLTRESKVIKQGFLLEPPENMNEKIYFLNQLTGLSNTLNGYLFRLHTAWKFHLHADAIKTLYFGARNSLEQLINGLLKNEQEKMLDLPISDFNVGNIILDLKTKCQPLQQFLDVALIDPSLTKLFLANIYMLIRKRHITYREVIYIEGICDTILHTADLNTRRFEAILLAWDFNTPEFFMYWVNMWQQQLTGITGLHEQLEMVTLEQDRIAAFRSKSHVRMIAGETSLKSDLQHFLGEKEQLVKQLIKLRRIVLKDNDLAKSAMRLRINLPVTQFGLFIRLQIESGMLPKENLGQIFTFFANHYSAKQALFISAESLQKKSTDIEHLTAQKMKGQLIWMVNWINEHYKTID